ncbi:MAG: protein kinase [Vicinamibacterales bacterium]
MVAPGSSFGPYRIVAPLGAGGMGEVYRAHDPRLGRDVAVKLLPDAAGGAPAAIERLKREARAVAALSHPGIVTIHDIGEQDGRVYVVSELLDGETLRQRLSRGPLPLREALDIAAAIARALAAAHGRGIVHRDLKPENVMVTAGGEVKLLDFGVAKHVTPPAEATGAATTLDLTAPGVAVGTLAYMAPEQLEGREVDHRADQFAFGLVIHELVTGQHPFHGRTAPEIAAAILRDTPPPLSGLRPPVPAGLSRVVARCLARSPGQRYTSTADLAQALDDVKADVASGALPVSRGGDRRARPMAWAVGAVAAAVALVAVAAWNFRTAPAVDPASKGRPANGVDQAVAVLPFATLGDGEAYLADGITEAVTRELGRVRSVRVLAANTAFAYRDRADALGGEFGVTLLVQGSVQRAGDRVRINATLVDSTRSTTLWSERYDRPSANVLALQDEIAWQVAAHLAANVGAAPPERPSPSQTTTPPAYDAYLRGLAHMKGRSGLTDAGRRLAASIEEFERAVALDADFALGHAMLASAYTQRFFYDATDLAFEQKAFVEIERALAINPDQAEAYLARAQIVWNVRNGFQHERAIRDLQKAIANNPNLAEAHIELGKVYMHIGLIDKAIAANDEALRLDPLATVAERRRLAALFDGQRFDEVRDVLARNPRWLAPSQRAEALLAMGDAGAAFAALSGPAGSDRRDTGFRDLEPTAYGALAHAYAKLGRRAEAAQALPVAIPLTANPTGLSDLHHAQFAIGCAYALLGQPDEAVRWLVKAAEEGLPSYPKYSGHVDVQGLKGHPGFDALLERLRRDWERWNATL